MIVAVPRRRRSDLPDGAEGAPVAGQAVGPESVVKHARY